MHRQVARKGRHRRLAYVGRHRDVAPAKTKLVTEGSKRPRRYVAPGMGYESPKATVTPLPRVSMGPPPGATRSVQSILRSPPVCIPCIRLERERVS